MDQRKWCKGGGQSADPRGACPVCGFKGRLTKYGIVRDHKDRSEGGAA